MKPYSKIMIVSNGTGHTTQVMFEGQPIKGITNIEIDSITPGGLVTAKLTIEKIGLDIQALVKNLK